MRTKLLLIGMCMVLFVGCSTETPTFQEQLDKTILDFDYLVEDLRFQYYTQGYYDCFEESDYLEQVCDRFNESMLISYNITC